MYLTTAISNVASHINVNALLQFRNVVRQNNQKPFVTFAVCEYTCIPTVLRAEHRADFRSVWRYVRHKLIFPELF